MTQIMRIQFGGATRATSVPDSLHKAPPFGFVPLGFLEDSEHVEGFRQFLGEARCIEFPRGTPGTWPLCALLYLINNVHMGGGVTGGH